MEVGIDQQKGRKTLVKKLSTVNCPQVISAQCNLRQLAMHSGKQRHNAMAIEKWSLSLVSDSSGNIDTLWRICSCR